MLAGLRSELGYQEPDNIDPFTDHLKPGDLDLLIRGVMEATDVPLSQRLNLVSTFFLNLASADPGQALQLLDELAPQIPERTGDFTSLLTETLVAVAGRDPQAASDWYRTHRESFGDPSNEMIPRRMLMNLANCNPAAAFDLIDTLEMKDRNGAINAIARGTHLPEQMNAVLNEARKLGADTTDPAAAAHEAAALQGLASAMSGVHSVDDGHSVTYGDETSYEASMSWLDSADLSPDQLRIIAGAIEPAAGKPGDNAKWIEWMTTLLPPEQVAERAGPMIASWAWNDPTNAERWLAATTEGPVKDAAIDAAVHTLANRNSDAALRIASMLPEGPRRDQLVAIASGK